MVDVNSVLEVVSKVVWTLLILGGIGLILWFALYWRKYNKHILILDQTAGGNLVREDKAKETYDGKNILCWQIRKEKVVVSCPPKEAVMIRNGKKFSILVRVQGDQYHWMNANEFKQDAEKSIGKYFVISEDAKRQLADQIKKAESERTTKMNQLIMQAIPLIMIGIVFIGAYFVWDVIGSKNADVAEALANTASQQAEIQKGITQSVALLNEVLQKNVTTVVINPTQNVDKVNQPAKVPN